MLVSQYKGRLSDELSCRIRKVENISVSFTTRKLKTCLAYFKAPIEKDLKGHVVYKIQCAGCNSCHIGQTARHLRTSYQSISDLAHPLGAILRNVQA